MESTVKALVRFRIDVPGKFTKQYSELVLVKGLFVVWPVQVAKLVKQR
jgi:hypothetical protein